ncbi:MAG: phosphoribosylamine--glycine ligase [Xanthobacteraceae bacterium]|nr:phosphoribosylamine--glycine ligase [Xanthobacteraceae bacterium]MBX3521957.1 phosphoribosylamine--glycine ligase [Xanthobacteraceae bacterium]MBX3535918.1 phosphoribosylamine--glycine ligase [Xanthobacteraceae bacterium]MCW5673703.1 phosphoribosylamine--glycine ligase [Xanthobacteraceae bacterium]MCW5678505.1 phosphoribosylamine--glycine ligase [Xanthobacteraceae bacterium]
MNVLLIGSGGREHALAWKLAASPLLTKLYAAPGNPGIAEDAEIVALKTDNHAAVIAFAKEKKIDLVVVGPEAPLTAGLADDLIAAGVKVFGPQKIPATLEGSKSFTKRLCAENNIPTAAFIETKSREAARAHIEKHGAPIVLKADGLHAGKGVIVAMDKAEALLAVDQVFAMGGNAPVVIEEFLDGEEASYFCFVHGEQVLPLASAQDHKRVFDNDQGPNTGGMGAYSPAPVFTKEIEQEVLEKIVRPTARALSKAGTPYSGVLYIGLMITKDGPKLIEYNVRFGDPECQVLMPRMKDDLLTLMLATANGELDKSSVRWRDEVAITVVFANQGYPGSYKSGAEIRGIEKANAIEGVTVFHAGTKRDGDKILSNGGRVLNVTALGKSVTEARERAYRAIGLIDWPQGFYRSDIGWRAIEREKAR